MCLNFTEIKAYLVKQVRHKIQFKKRGFYENHYKEGMRYRQKVVEYAIKCGNNTEAARRYHTSRN